MVYDNYISVMWQVIFICPGTPKKSGVENSLNHHRTSGQQSLLALLKSTCPKTLAMATSSVVWENPDFQDLSKMLC